MKHKHSFTDTILNLIRDDFHDEYKDKYKDIFDNSELLKYLNIKTKSANKGSKARGSFANIYAIYVLVEDYLNKGFHRLSNYDSYDGANFSDLFKRQRELPFGAKLQNHALNSRLNEEFKKYFPESDYQPIIRDVISKKYWFNENLLLVSVSGKEINIAETVIKIIDAYVSTKMSSFNNFLESCIQIKDLASKDKNTAYEFIKSQLAITVDARIFEIVSYSILKVKYRNESIFIGKSLDSITEESLMLFKTGRTNANDGGIDFVMKPLGRFFQVTETTDVTKYFLDIEKVLRYPITFVIKSEDSPEFLLKKIYAEAKARYKITAIIDRFMSSIEEIITVKSLLSILEKFDTHQIESTIENVVIQSKLEFNYDEISNPLEFIEYAEDIEDAMNL